MENFTELVSEIAKYHPALTAGDRATVASKVITHWIATYSN